MSIDLPVPPETKAKDVKCVIKAQAIELSVATLPEGKRDVLKGSLFQMVAADESNWTIANVDGGRFVQASERSDPLGPFCLLLRVGGRRRAVPARVRNWPRKNVCSIRYLGSKRSGLWSRVDEHFDLAACLMRLTRLMCG